MPGISVTNFVQVNVVISPLAIPTMNFGTMLILGPSAIIDPVERRRSYTDLPSVGADFGTSAPEYLAATPWFAQSPRPQQLWIGRWVASASAGLLHGGALSATQQQLSNFTGVTTGAFSISVDGTPHSITALNFSSVVNMPGVAAVLGTALTTWATVTWNSVYNRFEIVSKTTGTSSSVSYATAPGSGVDVSGLLGLTAATGAIAPVAGQASESALSATNYFMNQFQDWYALAFAAPSNFVLSDALAISPVIEASFPSRVFFYTTADANCLVSSSSSDAMSQIKALNVNRTFTQYSSTNPYAAISAMARAATVDFTGSYTTITLAFKQEPGVVAETLTQSQYQSILDKNGNVLQNVSNGAVVLFPGKMGSGQFFDDIMNTDWLANAIQTDEFNLMYQSQTKIPQTDDGMQMIANVAEFRCVQAVNNGMIAPGVWNGPNVGQLKTGNVIANGFYIYMPPIGSQAQSDREQRKAVTMQCAIKMAGAVHDIPVIINVNK